MGSTSNTPDNQKIYALIDYEDPYVQPVILQALKTQLPPSSYHLITSPSDLPSPSAKLLQFQQYESIDFPQHLSHPTSTLSNAYIIRKALIRKHYLSTTVSNWIVKHPSSALAKHVKPSVEFEVDYAEFLDDALVEAWELHASWEKGAGRPREEREWWILKPGMSERGQGIRLFSSEEELVGIFEGWDPESEDEDEEDEEGDARSDGGDGSGFGKQDEEEKEGKGIITSQLRHFIAQPYIHPPLLLPPPTTGTEDQAPRKFHIRTYVLATGALQVYVYKEMLALFAAKPYVAPWDSSFDDDGEALKSHLTNTCLQDSSEREGSVGLFWSLPASLDASNSPSPAPAAAESTKEDSDWRHRVFKEICAITSEVFEAAARSMSIHFQGLPNSFEIFGLDFMVGVEADGQLRTYLLEVNAFPDFRQTGEELKGLVEGLFRGVVDVGIAPFFGVERRDGGEGMVKVLDVDLGRR